MLEEDTGQFDGHDRAPPVCVKDVLRVWRRLLVSELPWKEMALDDIEGYMKRIVIVLIDEDRLADHSTRHWRLRMAARSHGIFRRSQQCAAECLQCEFDVLRYAIEMCLVRSRTSVSTKRGILAVLNAEFPVVLSAVAGGWFGQPPAPR